MCGIAGYLKLAATAPTPQLDLMLAAQIHRGPDAVGRWSDGECTLGHRRLAVIDLSQAANQPMGNHDGTVQIVFNGEIYNFVDLRRELEKRGYRFRSRSDTEVILHGYNEWGKSVLSRLRGMFAFAIWDQRHHRLFLARDRVGKKPLYYYLAPDRLIFSSELQGILADPTVPRSPDLGALDAYLSWGYVPPPRTAFADIWKLPPASSITVTPGQRLQEIGPKSYWELQYLPKTKVSKEEAAEELREKLIEAVRLRLISDVPLGAFLSGGIDSSIVVGIMAQLASGPVKTFSIGFAEQAFDELEHARRVAPRWSTDHHEEIVTPNALEVLPTLVRHYGEPFADSSAIPTFYVSKMAREHVTVALTGDGGDESFGGYERYRANLIADRLGHLPGKAVTATAQRLLPDSADPKNPLRRTRRFLQFAHEPQSVRYGHWIGYFDRTEKLSLYSAAFRNETNDNPMADRWIADLFASTKGLDATDAAMAVDVRSYLPSDILTKVDIASMSNSLEARSPFLDHEVMELAASLPRALKLRGSNHKRILKSTFSDLLPHERRSAKKMGFGVPVGEWFRGPLQATLRDALLGEEATARGYFDKRILSRMIDDHLQHKAENAAQLWSLLMLEMWHREMSVN